MTKATLATGIVEVKESNIVSKYVRFPLHDTSGLNAAYTTNLAGDSSITLTGSAVTWGQGLTCAGDNDWMDDTGIFDDLFNLDGNPDGALLIMGVLNYSTIPSAQETVLQSGANSRAAPGGIRLYVDDTKIQVTVYPQTTGESSSFANKTYGSRADEDIPFAILCDNANGTLDIAIDGEWANRSTEDTNYPAIQAANLLPATTVGANYGQSLFATHNAAVDSASDQINSGSGTIKFADLWVVKFISDPGDFVGEIVSEHAKYPHEVLRSLSGR